MRQYCESIYETKRWKTREVLVGNVGVGGNNPVRIQSMTTSSTRDVEATVDQIVRLADAGCEIVRVTVQGMKEADACEGIVNLLRQKGYTIPVVADIRPDGDSRKWRHCQHRRTGATQVPFRRGCRALAAGRGRRSHGDFPGAVGTLHSDDGNRARAVRGFSQCLAGGGWVGGCRSGKNRLGSAGAGIPGGCRAARDHCRVQSGALG